MAEFHQGGGLGLDVVTEADVRAAQTAVDGLDDLLATMDARGWTGWTVGQQRAVRGFLASFAADCRWAGYVEGKEAGRRLVGRAVREVLEDEGL